MGPTDHHWCPFFASCNKLQQKYGWRWSERPTTQLLPIKSQGQKLVEVYSSFFLFDVSIVNANVLQSFIPNRSKRLLDFRLELVKGLVGNFSSRKQATPNQRVQQGHWPFLILKDGASGASRIIRLNGAQWSVRNATKEFVYRASRTIAKLTWLDAVISNLPEHPGQNAFIYFVILFKRM